jgi:hypothetical protein
VSESRISKTACTVCSHPKTEEIDRLLVGGTGYRQITKRFGVSISALSRHRKNHLSPALQRVHNKREEKRGESLLDRVERLITRLEALADDAAGGGQARLLLDTAQQLRETYKLFGKLTGELDDRPQVVNVLVSAEYQQVRDAIIGALAAYPEARVAVSRRLLELETGGAGAGPPALPVVEGKAVGGRL